MAEIVCQYIPSFVNEQIKCYLRKKIFGAYKKMLTLVLC